MSFDAIAPHYLWLEWVTAGSLLQHCRTAFIRELVDARHILLLGDGRGRFLLELIRLNLHARITYVDASAKMLELTRAALVHHKLLNNRVQFIHADVLVPPKDSESSWQHSTYDAVASHFFHDCFTPEQLQMAVPAVVRCTAPGTRWLLSDFCVPDHGWQRHRARLVLACLYGFFRLITHLPAQRLTPPDLILQHAGFRLTQRKCFNFGLLHSDLWVRQN